MRTRVLLIDDDLDLCHLTQEFLQRFGYDITWRARSVDAFELFREQDFDVVVTDLNLGAESGLDLCRRFAENRPDTPVIVITGFGNMASAIAAIRAGAHDFITKPVDMMVLQHAIQRALQHRHLREKVRRLKHPGAAAEPGRLGSLVGVSPAMRAVFDVVRRVAVSDTTVLLQGESGTGKELVARALHDQSTHQQGPFLVVNCAEVPADILYDELFGSGAGPAMDGKAARPGLFEQAAGGTVLLDEVAEMPLEMQPRLLRVLSDRELRPPGGGERRPLTARIIAATHRDLEQQVAHGRFRQDLFYRLNVVQIALPPLRARGYDVQLLAEEFLRRFAAQSGKRLNGFSPEAQFKLMGYDWPGNVRQLENCIERAVALCQHDKIQLQDLPDRIIAHGTSAPADDLDLEHILTLDQLERRHIEAALERTRGNKTRAAKLLGIDRRTLHRKMEMDDAALDAGRRRVAPSLGSEPPSAKSER